MASHRYVSRRQAELEACDFSHEHSCTVTVYKLIDGRYENETGYDYERGGSAVARYCDGKQEF